MSPQTHLELDLRMRVALATAGLDEIERAVVTALCRDVVAMVPDLGLPHGGRTARDAVHLLVGTAVPGLPHDVLGALGRACEVAVVTPA